jgi:DNA polymerase I-like protein with 3'-5' exonuclease and polymerase domains
LPRGSSLAQVRACPVLFVHDEIVIEVAETDADEAKQRLVAAMTEAFVELYPEGAGMVGIVDAEIGKTWGG